MTSSATGTLKRQRAAIVGPQKLLLDIVMRYGFEPAALPAAAALVAALDVAARERRWAAEHAAP